MFRHKRLFCLRDKKVLEESEREDEILPLATHFAAAYMDAINAHIVCAWARFTAPKKKGGRNVL